jgi:hypothetical protein
MRTTLAPVAAIVLSALTCVGCVSPYQQHANILKQAYLRGDISSEEYQVRFAELQLLDFQWRQALANSFRQVGQTYQQQTYQPSYPQFRPVQLHPIQVPTYKSAPVSRLPPRENTQGVVFHSPDTTSITAGNVQFRSDGTSTIRGGNTYFHSDGSSTIRSGNTLFNSDGSSSQRIGNTVFHSANGSSILIGDTWFHSDGSTSIRIGDTWFHSK